MNTTMNNFVVLDCNGNEVKESTTPKKTKRQTTGHRYNLRSRNKKNTTTVTNNATISTPSPSKTSKIPDAPKKSHRPCLLFKLQEPEPVTEPVTEPESTNNKYSYSDLLTLYDSYLLNMQMILFLFSRHFFLISREFLIKFHY